jgi:hypothetical protein
MYVSGGLWVAGRAVQSIRWFWINGGKGQGGSVGGGVRGTFRVLGIDKIREKEWTIEMGERENPVFADREEFGYAYTTDDPDMVSTELVRRNATSVYAYGVGHGEGIYTAPPLPAGAGGHMSSSALPSPPSTSAHSDPALPPPVKPALLAPPGYTVFQLLPGKTLKMTIRTSRKLRWRPGQHILLTVPEISSWQSHPYTICNASGNEIVLLLRARKGFTLDLWKAVVSKRRQSSGGELVMMRAKVSQAMGSTARVEWDNWSTVVIFCGGTGVSFGLSILEHVCRRIAAREREDGDESGGSGPKRVVFVWLLREHGVFLSRVSVRGRRLTLFGVQRIFHGSPLR